MRWTVKVRSGGEQVAQGKRATYFIKNASAASNGIRAHINAPFPDYVDAAYTCCIVSIHFGLPEA